MLSRPTINFYNSAEAAVPSPSFITDVFPGEKRDIFSCARHSRRHSHDIENASNNHDAFAPSLETDRRRTINFGLARPPLTPWGDRKRIVRILPQRIINPRSTAGAQSVWFQSQNEHPDFGVSLSDVLDGGTENLMVAPEERVFQRLGLDCEEIQFTILWPGYGHVSWIASIPIDPCEESGYQDGPITRRLLASAVAQHFRAFMTNHSYLRFPNPDPDWKIMNEQESGIRFEHLRLTRLFSHKNEAGKLSSWQAEILVLSDVPTG
ncbi:hypothetical protein BJ322DRAFT_1217406 [Thelephora terrestris]|uniref:Uncharacterized protein n=1 Tax=Thelephora terrestris TaxID=56493 RepID=A0A9P6HJT4_9AGAM|nr:hypothetical protein BJ322DRAFT_1217406 [Thelephora terrestris]